MARRVLSIIASGAFALCLAVTGNFLDEHAAYAQGGEDDYADVAVILEAPNDESTQEYLDLNIVVVNNGSRTAYDVEVVVDVVYPTNSSHFTLSGQGGVIEVPVGSVSLENSKYRLRWSIPELGGLQREEITAELKIRETSSPTFDKRSYVHEVSGKVTTSSFDRNPGNNTSRVWSVPFASPPLTSHRAAQGNYTVAVTVDEPFPSQGDTVNFTITAGKQQLSGSIPIDLQVAIDLTDGLTVSGAPRYVSTHNNGDEASTPPSVSYDNGVFTIGTLKYDDPEINAVTLPVRVASSAVVNEQCLTATLTGNPPPGTGPLDDDISDNVVKACLVESDQKVLLRSGQANLLALYPCVGEATHPCDSSDSVVLAIDVGKAAPNAGYPSGTFQPENVIVQIRDPEGRSGSDWRTGNDVDYTPTGAGILPGIAGKLTIPIGTDGYTQHTFAIDDSAYGGNPGEIELLLASTNFTVLNTDSQLTFGPANLTISPYDIQFEFDKLGTYQADISLGATKSSVPYTSQKTYTFHVGPIAELEVRDGGASSQVAADRNALTVVAVNNGPDDPPGGATVTGLPTGAEVLHISHGSYDDTTGEWNIDRLRVRGYYRSAGESEPTLVLGASAGDTATVSISSAEDYAVCFNTDGSEHSSNRDGVLSESHVRAFCTDGRDFHSTAPLDYIEDNDEVTLIARRGTDELPEGAPAHSERTDDAVVIVEWTVVETVNAYGVTHYEVWRQDDDDAPWERVERKVGINQWLDWRVNPRESYNYRVRAVNLAGVPGPWSRAMELAAISTQQTTPTTSGAPDKPVLTATASGRTEIDLTWEMPTENGSPITSYTIEVADSANGPWSVPDPAPELDRDDTSWTHTGLTGGTTSHYRLRATNMCGNPTPESECHSPWSDTATAQTDAPGTAGAPVNLTAAAEGGNAIVLTWEAPEDDGGSPALYYEVDYSADTDNWSADTASWSRAGRTDDGDTLTFRQDGLSFGETRHYRVRARNNAGWGDWSDSASATTAAGVPGAPALRAEAESSEAIKLTWTAPDDNGSAITGYDLEVSEDGSEDSWSALAALTDQSDLDARTYTHDGLEPGDERHYRVRAKNSEGGGSWSSVASATTEAAAPDKPALTAVANGETQIDLAWTAPEDNGSPINLYELHVSADGSDESWSGLAHPRASDRAYTHSGLQPGDERHYRLRARNSADWSEWSEPVSATTLTGVPEAPTLTASANGATEIRLSWSAPDAHGSEILRYELQVSEDGSAWPTDDNGEPVVTEIPADAVEYIHGELRGGTERNYRIRAVNGNGEGVWSQVRSATTSAAAPDAPADLTATANGETQINLAWTAPADNGSAITGYRIERRVEFGESWDELSGRHRNNTYSDTTVYSGTTYYYRVAAINRAGTGPYSEVEATTIGESALPPDAPALLYLSAVSRNQVTIAWEPPAADGGAPVTGYEYAVGYPCEGDPWALCEETGKEMLVEPDWTATTGTSATIRNLNMDGGYSFWVRAVNAIGKGFDANIPATLRPSTGGQVIVSPTNLTVDEGGRTATYTVRLGTQPAQPVYVIAYAFIDGDALIVDTDNHLPERTSPPFLKLLVPDGWKHPGGEDWSEFARNWRQGISITVSALEDDNAANELVAIHHEVFTVPPEDLGNNPEGWEPDPVYEGLTGAGVKVTVRDDD